MSTQRPGRPPLDPTDPSVPVHVRLPSRKYDELYARAQRERLSVPAFIRQLIERAAHGDDDDQE